MADKVDRDSLASKYERMDGRPWHYLTIVLKKWEMEVGRVLESFDITRPQVEFLMCIVKFNQDGRTVTQKDVARALGRAENTASGIFRTLEKKGYITRATPEEDQRTKQIVITEKGLLLVQKSITEILAVDERLFPDDRDNAELIRLLKKYF
jgi:DNA-binding MarR family transcriptional regulator